jgi:hypothetical protein
MHPLHIELAKRFDPLTTRDQILEAIFDLEALNRRVGDIGA